MAIARDIPYAGFNFLVNWGDADPNSAQGGFMEVTGLGMEVSVVEYRNGNDKTNAPRKLPGLIRPSEIHLRRGVIGTNSLFAWVQSALSGQLSPRDITIQLLSEDRKDAVLTWVLSRALPVRYSGPALSAVAHHVAMEELVLTCQSINLT